VEFTNENKISALLEEIEVTDEEAEIVAEE
jgi:hypothetical protein